MATKDISDLQVCAAYLQAKQVRQFPYEILAHETGEPEKVCYRAMERAHDRGLIEYGVSLRSGWLTEKGMAILQSAYSSLQ